MARRFNVTGSCSPKKHYMVDITGRPEKIKRMVGAGEYFMINCVRQYGKTTLKALAEYLKKDYIVLSLDFQMMSCGLFDRNGFLQGVHGIFAQNRSKQKNSD